MSNERDKTYLGDGVYATFDGHNIVLRTSTSAAIYLEPEVMQSLKDYDWMLNNKYFNPNKLLGNPDESNPTS